MENVNPFRGLLGVPFPIGANPNYCFDTRGTNFTVPIFPNYPYVLPTVASVASSSATPLFPRMTLTPSHFTTPKTNTTTTTTKSTETKRKPLNELDAVGGQYSKRRKELLDNMQELLKEISPKTRATLLLQASRRGIYDLQAVAKADEALLGGLRKDFATEAAATMTTAVMKEADISRAALK